MKWIFPTLILTLGMTLVSCSGKQKEMDDLAKGQKCLDEVPQSNPQAAENCLVHVDKYTSQQANILKCSIHMTRGGLIESKIVKAYKAVDDDSNSNREATFMAVLALDTPNVTDAYPIAVEGDKYCQQTGVPGLMYISGVVKIGSFMAKTMAAVGSVDFNDTTAVKNAANALIADCNANPRGASCPTDLSDIGSSAVALSGSYCSSDNADSEVCENINAAVAGANGDNAVVGNALMCYLGNKTYNTQTGQCNP